MISELGETSMGFALRCSATWEDYCRYQKVWHMTCVFNKEKARKLKLDLHLIMNQIYHAAFSKHKNL